MEFQILSLDGKLRIADLTQIGNVFPFDDVIYIDGEPCCLSTATPSPTYSATALTHIPITADEIAVIVVALNYQSHQMSKVATQHRTREVNALHVLAEELETRYAFSAAMEGPAA